MSDTQAHAAAALWGLGPKDVTLAARRENIVYRCNSPTGGQALRLHRAGYRTRTQLVSELEWMAALAERGLRVPHPLPSDGGALIEMLGDTPVSMLNWLDGTPAGAGNRLDVPDRGGFMQDLGRVLADLHDASDAWTPPQGFDRPSWDLDGLLGEAPVWGPFWDNPDLQPGDREILLELRDRARDQLTGMQKDLDYGLIHADILTENVLIHRGQLALIDFDDGGWGFRDFELATFLMRFLDAPDYMLLRDRMLSGYARRRPVDPRVLELFILLRSLTYLGWTIPRRQEPGGRDRSYRAVATAMPLVRAFLCA